MRIGEVSKLTNVSMRSLRYYEEKGLIHPERLENGYRDYDKLTLERIKTLKLYFDLGLTTAEMQQVMGCDPFVFPYKNLMCKDVIMIYGDYHEGVLGIVASNIVERYQRPVLIMTNKDGILKGSARSIFDFNIYTAVNKIGDKFIAYGGHTLAAGFSFEENNFETIEEELNKDFAEYKNTNELKSTKTIDIVTSLEEMSYQFLNSLDALKPYGMDFEKPTILLENAKILDKAYFGAEKQYMRLTIADEVGSLECISFKENSAFNSIEKNDIIDLLCTLDKNNFNGRTKLQAHIIDMEIKEFLFKDLRGINFNIDNIPNNKMGLDIGEKTVKLFDSYIKTAKTVVWNGPMGVFEMSNFAKGTIGVCESIASLTDAVTIIGGGDSAAAAISLGYADKFTHISTGGGASLEFLEGKVLPGVEAISNK